MKSVVVLTYPHGVNKSLPVRGAWIEICPFCRNQLSSPRRSPCGERGLKYEMTGDLLSCDASLPVRGAWIEIVGQKMLCRLSASLPVRGAWIEIAASKYNRGRAETSLPVRGAWIEIDQIPIVSQRVLSLPVRGAWIEIWRVQSLSRSVEVAPRAGSVD